MLQIQNSINSGFRRVISMTIVLMFVLSLFSQAKADVITDWNEIAVRSYVEAGIGHQRGARALAILHVAIHDALNDIERRYDTYAVNAYAAPHASPEAAVAAAAHAVLIAAIPSQQASIDAAYALSLSQIPDGEPKTDGIALGERVAAAITGLRSADGSAATVAYTPVNEPGRWQPTPPDFLPPLLPQWRYLTPFTLVSASQFRAPGPPALTSRAYARDFNEVKEIGRIDSTRRTEEQSEIAQFWYEGSPITWNLIARTVAADRPNDLWEHARLFALLNLALSDSWVAGWDTKYIYLRLLAARHGDSSRRYGRQVRLGSQIGRYVFQNSLRPFHDKRDKTD